MIILIVVAIIAYTLFVYYIGKSEGIRAQLRRCSKEAHEQITAYIKRANGQS